MKCPVCDTRIKKDLTICPECGNGDFSIRHVLYSKEEINHAEEVLKNKRKAWQEREYELKTLKSDLKKAEKEKKKLMEQQRLISEQMKEIQKKSDEQLKTSEIKKADLMFKFKKLEKEKNELKTLKSELKKAKKEKKKLMEQQQLMSKQMKEIQEKSDEKLEKEKNELLKKQLSMAQQIEEMQKALEKQKKTIKKLIRVNEEKESKPSFFSKIHFPIFIDSLLFGFAAGSLSPPMWNKIYWGKSTPVPAVDIISSVPTIFIAGFIIHAITYVFIKYFFSRNYLLDVVEDRVPDSEIHIFALFFAISVLPSLIWILFNPVFHLNGDLYAIAAGIISGILNFLVIANKIR